MLFRRQNWRALAVEWSAHYSAEWLTHFLDYKRKRNGFIWIVVLKQMKWWYKIHPCADNSKELTKKKVFNRNSLLYELQGKANWIYSIQYVMLYSWIIQEEEENSVVVIGKSDRNSNITSDEVQTWIAMIQLQFSMSYRAYSSPSSYT